MGAFLPVLSLVVGLTVAPGEPHVVVATITNDTAAEVTVDISSVQLTTIEFLEAPDKFWAPFHLRTGAPRRLEDGRRTPRLGPRETVIRRLDLLRLKWGRAIGPFWPDWGLRDVVAAGSYRVWVEVDLLTGGERTTAKSPSLVVNLS